MTDGDERLPGVALVEEEVAKATARVALDALLTPETQNLDPADFADIGRATVDAANPDRMRPMLLSARRAGNATLLYTSEDRTKVFVSVSPGSFGEFAGNPETIFSVRRNNILEGYDESLKDNVGETPVPARSEENIRTANRGAARLLQDKIDQMEEHLKEEVYGRLYTIAAFRRTFFEYPKLVRPAGYARERTTHLFNHVFSYMLDAMGQHENWTEARQQRAYQILQKRFLIDEEGDRLGSLLEMLSFAEDYYLALRSAMVQKIHYARYVLTRRHQEAYEDMLAVTAERETAKQKREEAKLF